MEKTINITIDPVGNPKIDAKGFVDGACAKATEGLTKLLSSAGSNVVIENKPEYFIPETSNKVEQVERNW